MTKMVYTVINRPKKDETGRTDIGWKEDGASEEVTYAGFLITSRTKKGEVRTYTAFVITSPADFSELKIKKHLGDDFTSRAQAAFAIWRAYYLVDKAERHMKKWLEENERNKRRIKREDQKKFRATPAGMEAYRKELNEKARVRRASMTPEEKANIATRRREKRKLKKE